MPFVDEVYDVKLTHCRTDSTRESKGVANKGEGRKVATTKKPKARQEFLGGAIKVGVHSFTLGYSNTRLRR